MTKKLPADLNVLLIFIAESFNVNERKSVSLKSIFTAKDRPLETTLSSHWICVLTKTLKEGQFSESDASIRKNYLYIDLSKFVNTFSTFYTINWICKNIAAKLTRITITKCWTVILVWFFTIFAISFTTIAVFSYINVMFWEYDF